MSHLVAALMIRRKLLVKIRLYISAHRLMREVQDINILTGRYTFIISVCGKLEMKVESNVPLFFDLVSLVVSSYFYLLKSA